MEEKYYMPVGMQLNAFHASKLFMWLNHVKYPSIKEKYESWKACNTWESFHVCKSFIKIFGRKNNKCIGGFCLNLSVVLIWSNMSNTIIYLHRTPQTRHSLWPNMSDIGRICLTLIRRFWKTILFWWLRTTPILVDNETGCIGKLTSLSFHAYEECLNQRSYMSCVSI
jgi:hypothetical protein